MKILWVCNTMLPVVAEYLNKEASNKEGWLSGLCQQLMEQNTGDVELHVAFPVDIASDGLRCSVPVGNGILQGYGFYEDTVHPEVYDAELEKKLGDLIQEISPDVVHCFGTEFGHTLAVLKGSLDTRKVLVGIQGLCSVVAKAYMADLPISVQKRKTFRDYLKKDGLQEQQEKFRVRGEREKEIFRLAENVTGRTGYDKFYALKENPQVRYFSMNETLRAPFYESRWQRENAQKHSIFLSQGDYPLKGFHYLCEAGKLLLSEYPDLEIYVAGNSLVNYTTLKDKIKISGYGQYLRKLIRQCGLENKVHILGKLTATEMLQQYLKSSIFVCCSANENSPNSLGEAMLLGMPCVATDVGGVSDVFAKGKDGILCLGSHAYLERDDYGYEKYQNVKVDTSQMSFVANQVAEAIRVLWTKETETNNYCENARAHALENHNKEKNYQKLLEIYREISEQ